MKKTLLTTLALSAILALSGCGTDSKEPTKQVPSNQDSVTTGPDANTSGTDKPNTDKPGTDKEYAESSGSKGNYSKNIAKPYEENFGLNQGGTTTSTRENGGIKYTFKDAGQLFVRVDPKADDFGLTEKLPAGKRIGITVVGDIPENTYVRSAGDMLNWEIVYLKTGKGTTYMNFDLPEDIPENAYFIIHADANTTLFIKNIEVKVK
ncbi:MAG: hypothetical protein L3J43_01860 [Sulfurovum sp.]|nr:hypothetical protein [Sulfurovum sp.]